MGRDRDLVTDGQIQIQLASVQTPSPQADGMSEGRESAVAGELHTTPTWSQKINLCYQEAASTLPTRIKMPASWKLGCTELDP